MVEGAMRLQAGLAMVGLVHDLARHARNVNDWAISLRPALKEISLKAGIPETVDDMIASADVVGKITSSMDKLALGRDDSRIRIHIDERLESMKAVLTQLDRRIKVDVKGSATIIGPDSLVERIVFNLVVNSLHWTRDEDRDIRVAFEREDNAGTATLSVTDNGQGMTPEQLSIVREPFESFRENGSGLGLFLVDQLCKTAGAQLSIFSEPFRSTTVLIAFESLEG
jgi:signal transduction histidine kinase